MLNNIEFIVKITFIVSTIVWAGKILVLRTDKQIVINPLLLVISSILVILPKSNENTEILGLSIEAVRIGLYAIYTLVVVFGVYSTKRKNGIF